MGRGFQMVQKQKFVQSYHLPITSRHLDRHTTYDHPPSIRDKLNGSDLKFVQKLHDEWMDGEMKATQKVSLTKTHLSMSKVTSFLTQAR